MALPQTAIRRPVTVLMGVIIALFMGLVSIFYLPVELMPNISYGIVSIIINIRGGIPPVEVEERVSKPIEEAVGTVSHLEEMLSISKEGESTVQLSFKPGTNMNFAALEVREKFAKVKNKLPKEIEKPIIANYRYSDYPIMIIALTSNIYSPEYLRRVADEKIKDRIKRVTGVANVDVGGGRERKILVEVDQRRLAAHSLSLNKVLSILGMNNLNLLAGEVEKREEKYLVRTMGEFESVEEIKNIGVTTSPTGSIIRLKDIAEVKDSYMEPVGFARLNVRPVVSMFIYKESTGNTIRIIDGINEQLDMLKEGLDKNIKMTITFNQAEFIRESIDKVSASLLGGALLAIIILVLFLTKLPQRLYWPVVIFMAVILFLPTKLLYVVLAAVVILLFSLKNMRFVLIISIAIPVSVMIAFALMYLLNVSNAMFITLNIMTLFGMALGIGMLVDNAIVVLENIFRHKTEGKDTLDATIAGSEEMTRAIVAGTLTTLVVFLPILFVNVQTKLLYGGVGVTVTFSLLASLLVALTVVPLLSSRSELIAVSPPWIERLCDRYKRWLVVALRHRKTIIKWVVLFFAIAAFWFSRLDKEFMGSTQQSDFTVFVRMPTGTKLEMSDLACKKVEEVLRTVPEVKNMSSHVEPWISKVYIKLIPLTKRRKSTKEVIESIRSQVENIRLYHPQDETIEQPFIYFEEPQEVGTKEIILDIYGYDYKTLRELAVVMSRRMGGIKGLTDVKIRMREGRPEMEVIVNKQKAGLYGLKVNDIALAVHAQMRGMRGTYYHGEGGQEVETIARIDEKYRRTFKDLKNLVLSTPDGKNILLSQVADFKFSLGPSEIWRKDKSRMIQLSASVGALSLGRAVKLINNALKDIGFPEEYYYRFGGGYPELVEMQKQFIPTILLMMALVYMVMAGLFESYSHPFIIMFSVPLAIIGVTIALVATKKSVSMGVVVGLVLLGGIVVNNAIILIDRINQLRQEGYRKIKAIVTSGGNRLRPILMTTSTTILGLLPLAVDKSESSNLWSPLAITVISGLTSSTILTLFVVPAVYLIFEEYKERFIKK